MLNHNYFLAHVFTDLLIQWQHHYINRKSINKAGWMTKESGLCLWQECRFSLLHNIQANCGAYSATYLMNTDASFREDKSIGTCCWPRAAIYLLKLEMHVAFRLSWDFLPCNFIKQRDINFAVYNTMRDFWINIYFGIHNSFYALFCKLYKYETRMMICFA